MVTCFASHCPSNVFMVERIVFKISKLESFKSGTLPFKVFKETSPSVSFVRRFVSSSNTPKYRSYSSGGIVPSSIASKYPLMEVKGERKSWEILEIKSFRYCSVLLSSVAIKFKEETSSPISSYRSIGIKVSKSPLA